MKKFDRVRNVFWIVFAVLVLVVFALAPGIALYSIDVIYTRSLPPFSTFCYLTVWSWCVWIFLRNFVRWSNS